MACLPAISDAEGKMLIAHGIYLWVGDAGIHAEGKICSDPEIQHQKFRGFLAGETAHLFLGLHDIKVIHTALLLAEEVLCRGLGSNYHSAPGILFLPGERGLTMSERKDLVCITLQVLSCLGQTGWVNCSSAMLSDHTMRKSIQSCRPLPRWFELKKRIGVELTDFPNLSLVYDLFSEGMDVVLDDVEPENWVKVKELLPFIRGIKISYMTSLRLFPGSVPYLAPGLINKNVRTRLETWSESERLALVASFNQLLYWCNKCVTSVNKCRLNFILVIECSTSPEQLSTITCRTQFPNIVFCSQGQDTHAMVKRIWVPDGFFCVDKSAAERNVPRHHRLFVASDADAPCIV